MTSTEPAPIFRRFPWIQLVFCLACLSMAAWSWMRYSYCWVLDPETIGKIAASTRGDVIAAFDGYEGRFVVLRGAPTYAFGMSRSRGACWLDGTPLFWYIGSRRRPDQNIQVVAVPSRNDWELTHVPMLSKPYWEHCHQVVYGRATFVPEETRWKTRAGTVVVVLGPTYSSNRPWTRRSRLPLTVTAASRWHPTSVGGLAVAAMGCFIFGLYLRGWLRERKALASQPE